MSDSANHLPHLTKQEIKLIMLLRLQSEEKQKQIIKKATEKSESDKAIEDNENEICDCAYWLNTKHYKK
ncbi:MAG: hypothetical protein MJ147_05530 [Clostridia bacterium]|nr:hypothetical protein [Clostridia bacterium]